MLHRKDGKWNEDRNVRLLFLKYCTDGNERKAVTPSKRFRTCDRIEVFARYNHYYEKYSIQTSEGIRRTRDHTRDYQNCKIPARCIDSRDCVGSSVCVQSPDYHCLFSDAPDSGSLRIISGDALCKTALHTTS